MAALGPEDDSLLRSRINEVLENADLATVSAKKIRLALADMPAGHLPAQVDLVAHKKEVDAVIRQCYEAFTAKKPTKAKAKAANTEETEAPKTKTKTTRKRVAADSDGGEKKKRAPNPNSPFNRPVRLSSDLAEICGGNEMPRHAVVKQLWVYIKDKSLQNDSNRRQVRCALTQIMCDDKLTGIFGKSTVEYVRPLTTARSRWPRYARALTQLIGPHLEKIEPRPAASP